MKQDLLDMAEAVSKAVLDIPIPERAREVAMGADGTPTSFVDRVAEEVIVDFVEDREIPVNILSEEAGFIDRGFDDILVIDPVDGTHNCKRGIPYYSVSLAVGRDDLDGLEFGLVMNIPTGDVFFAAEGGGAILNGRKITVEPAVGEMTVNAYFGNTVDNAAVMKALAPFQKVRCLGAASLDICGVAAGQQDAYFLKVMDENRSLRITDIAAGILILREAGGEAYNTDGGRLKMRLALDDRSNMLALGDAKLLEEIL